MNLKNEFLATCSTVMPHVIDEQKPGLDTKYLFAPKLSDEFIGYQILRVDRPFLSSDVMVIDDTFRLSRCGMTTILNETRRLYEIEGLHDVLSAKPGAESSSCYEAIEERYNTVLDAIHIPMNHVFCGTLIGLFTPEGVLECIIDLGEPWNPKRLKSA